MRLIDADALKKDDELTEWIARDTIRTGKMLKAFSELFVKKIDDAPTVNAVPMSVIEEIKAKIAQNSYPIIHGINNHEQGMTLNGIFQAIDETVKEHTDAK